MTKEEQRFTAAVAAMNGLLANNSFIFNMNNDDKPDCDNLLSYAIDCADTLIKELDKHNPSHIDVINAAIKHVEDMGFKPNRFVNIVEIDVNNCIVGCDNAYYYSWYKCTQHNCDNDRIDQGDNYCSECGSKIEWVIEENEPLPPYEKDLFANSKNGDGKKYDVIVADTVVAKANPDAKVVTKTQITTQNINSIKTTPDQITEPSMITICGIKLRKWKI